MQFVEIPVEAENQRPWLTKTDIGAPEGQEEHISSLSALRGFEEFEGIGRAPVIRFCAEATPEDIEALKNGAKVWVEILAPVMFPISIEVGAT